MSGMTAEERFIQQQEELNKKLDRIANEDLPTANIIVAGITGTGKSTLINAVFGSELAKTGSGQPVTEHIDEYTNNDIPIHIWDTVGLELDSEKTAKSIASIKETIAKKASTDDQFDRVHAIWYCINSGSNRYQGTELEFIKELYSTHLPFIIVLTQCHGSKKNISEFEDKIREINEQEGLKDISIIQVLAKDYEIEIDEDNTISKRAYGLNNLVDETLRRLPEFIKSGFVAAQRVSKSQKRAQCEDIIYEFAKAAKEGFWDKVPLINFITTDKKIIRMLERIGKIYNTVLTDDSIKRIDYQCRVNFGNNFWGLLAPIDFVGYNDKVKRLLSRKKQDGFEVKAEVLSQSDRAARMIVFYGYTFIESIEELWQKFTEEQLEDVDIVVDNLIRIIDRKLRERSGNRETSYEKLSVDRGKQRRIFRSIIDDKNE